MIQLGCGHNSGLKLGKTKYRDLAGNGLEGPYGTDFIPEIANDNLKDDYDKVKKTK